jgi:C4-dicarboxylate-specific signal transduction histidine kinase
LLKDASTEEAFTPPYNTKLASAQMRRDSLPGNRVIRSGPELEMKICERDQSMISYSVAEMPERVREHEPARTEGRPTRISVRGELAATIVHEVNQPLAAMRTNIETGLRYLNRPDPNVAEAREAMQRSLNDVCRAADLVSSIRAMAAGRCRQRTILSLQDIIDESLVFLHNELQSTGVSVAIDFAPSLPTLSGDRIQLQQVVVNLAINAVQAMAQSASAERKLLIRTKLSDPWISCSLEDSGPGIDPPHLGKLFRGCFTTKDSGMGIGLPVCRSIVEAHGGELRADNDSTLGGARFSFRLPLSVVSLRDRDRQRVAAAKPGHRSL